MGPAVDHGRRVAGAAGIGAATAADRHLRLVPVEGRCPRAGRRIRLQTQTEQKGEEVGGFVPHVTLKSIANNQPPAEEVLVDRPEVNANVTRVTGPFCVEATIPTPVDWEGDGVEDSGAGRRRGPRNLYGTHVGSAPQEPRAATGQE